MFVSGQLPAEPSTGELVAGGIEAQTRRSLANVQAVLAAAGTTMQKVVKTTVLLQHMADFAAMNRVYAEVFAQECPARSCFEVGCLPKDALVEIEVIALA